jgi:hypothetical protein
VLRNNRVFVKKSQGNIRMSSFQARFSATCLQVVLAMAICGDVSASTRSVPVEGDAVLAADSEGAASCAVTLDGRIGCRGPQPALAADAPRDGRFLTVSTSGRHACAIRSDGEVLCWGANDLGQSYAPQGLQAIAVRADPTGSCAMRVDGMVVCWGVGGAVREKAYSWVVPDVRSAPGIGVGDAHACVLDGPRSPRCWGDDSLGQTRAVDRALRQIDVQGDHSCGVGLDGLVACWGDPKHGGSTPVDGAMRQVEVGQFNACALRGDGRIVCWGWGVNGQSRAPDGRFRAVATGLNHSCAIRDDGQLVCWGYNAEGQSSPPAGRFRKVAVGERHSCAIGRDAQIRCWGLSGEGQTRPPTSGSGFREIAVGPFHGCAIRGDGGLDCWGRNDMGQATPPSDGRYLAVSAGFAQSCAIRIDGGRVCWGGALAEDGGRRRKSLENALAVDTTPPVITHTRTPLNGTRGPVDLVGVYWQRGDVRITWSVTDPESAIVSSSGCESVDYTYDIFRVQCVATSAGGQATGYALVLRDVTPPTITARVAREPNNWGWYSSGVSVEFACSDATSGVWWCPNSQYIMEEGAGVSRAEIISDYAGNTATSNVFSVNIDRTPPSIVGTPRVQPNEYGWHRQDVTYDFTCTDNLSGFAEGTCPPARTISTEAFSQVTTVSMYDRAGNLGSLDLFPKIDKTPPLLIHNTIPSLVLLNQAVTPSPVFHDSLSGLLSVDCPPMDTATVGQKTATCTARDLAGNTASASRSYRVVYAIGATLPPLSDRTRTYELRSLRYATLEWTAKDASDLPVNNVSLVRASATPLAACPSAQVVTLPASTAAAGDSYFESLGEGRYRYHWWVPTPTSVGCVSLTLELDDGSRHTAVFRVVPKTMRTGGPQPAELPRPRSRGAANDPAAPSTNTGPRRAGPRRR